MLNKVCYCGSKRRLDSEERTNAVDSGVGLRGTVQCLQLGGGTNGSSPRARGGPTIKFPTDVRATGKPPAVVASPRLPVRQFVLLRRLVDRLIACPSETRYPGEAGRFRLQRPTIRRRNRFDRLSME